MNLTPYRYFLCRWIFSCTGKEDDRIDYFDAPGIKIQCL